MPQLKKLMRNLRHPAHNSEDCFDDHDVSFFASLYLQIQPIYVTDPKTAIAVCYDVYQTIREHPVGLGVANYDKARRECGLPVRVPEKRDIAELFYHFSRLDPLLLRPWSDVVAQTVSGKVTGADDKTVFVQPIIKECLFCQEQKLNVAVRKTSGKGCAKGGHFWSYEYDKGAQIAVLFNSTCPQCWTDYSLQTYTPGRCILARLGM
jgi:hypothetical protein